MNTHFAMILNKVDTRHAQKFFDFMQILTFFIYLRIYLFLFVCL